MTNGEDDSMMTDVAHTDAESLKVNTIYVLNMSKSRSNEPHKQHHNNKLLLSFGAICI